MKVVVTGGSGKAGRWVVRRLVEAGYEVRNVDLMPPPAGPFDKLRAHSPLPLVEGIQKGNLLPHPGPRSLGEGNIDRLRVRSPRPLGTATEIPFLRADLTDFGQAVDALKGFDAVVHLAAIPAPGLATDEVTFRTNVSSTWNVFSAAATLKMPRVVWASSETVLGLPFKNVRPDYAPIDESCTRFAESAYALSKVAGEDMAKEMARWSKLPIIALRFSNIIEPGDYARFEGWQDDISARQWNMWGYVDARDCAQACERALAVDTRGWERSGPVDTGSAGLAQAFIVAAADTVMRRPSSVLLAEAFPDVRVKGRVKANETLLAIKKAGAMLGYRPEVFWQLEVADAGKKRGSRQPR